MALSRLDGDAQLLARLAVARDLACDEERARMQRRRLVHVRARGVAAAIVAARQLRRGAKVTRLEGFEGLEEPDIVLRRVPEAQAIADAHQVDIGHRWNGRPVVGRGADNENRRHVRGMRTVR